MFAESFRQVAGLASVPAGAVVGGVHQLVAGTKVVLDLTLSSQNDLFERQQFLVSLRAAASDPRIVGVIVTIESAPSGWASLQDVREGVHTLTASGKVTVAMLEAPGNAALWLAGAFEHVFLLPTGEVGLVGFGTEMTFFGALFDKLGIQADLVAAGEYKSFGEQWQRSFGTPENQEALGTVLRDLQRQMLADIASDRGLELDMVVGLLEQAPLSAEVAVAEGLVDRLLYADEVDDWAKEQFGEGMSRLAFDKWQRFNKAERWVGAWGGPAKQVAVVHLEGAIVLDDPSNQSRIRARTVVELLKDLREDDKIGAIVLHVNSPGGSALASDMIWREVKRTLQTKPVVACFEDVSASGGFYLSACASAIIARPGTITGSIGVFGGKIVLGEALRKVGVHTQEVSAAPNATVYSPSRPFSEPQRERFRNSMQRVYDNFVSRVAEGRKADVEVIEPYCRGRIWTGADALERGLVDGFGDVDTAIEKAKQLAELQEARRVDFSGQPERPWLQRMVGDAVRDNLPGAQALVGAWMPRVASDWLQLLVQHEGQALALLPFDLRLR